MQRREPGGTIILPLRAKHLLGRNGEEFEAPVRPIGGGDGGSRVPTINSIPEAARHIFQRALGEHRCVISILGVIMEILRVAGDELVIQLSPMVLTAQDKVNGEPLDDHSHEFTRAMAEPDTEGDQPLIPSAAGQGIDSIITRPLYDSRDAFADVLLSGVPLSPSNTDSANA